jgi:MFS family permease
MYRYLFIFDFSNRFWDFAKLFQAAATWAGDRLTHFGFGRKPLFLAGIVTLPLRCALIIYWKDAGAAFLLSTQILDGLGGGLFGLIHPFLVADMSFGTGRFNLMMGLTASTFGLGATLSNFLGQRVVERYGHVASLTASLILSVIPILICGCFMPETLGDRDHNRPKYLKKAVDEEKDDGFYIELNDDPIRA